MKNSLSCLIVEWWLTSHNSWYVKLFRRKLIHSNSKIQAFSTSVKIYNGSHKNYNTRHIHFACKTPVRFHKYCLLRSIAEVELRFEDLSFWRKYPDSDFTNDFFQITLMALCWYYSVLLRKCSISMYYVIFDNIYIKLLKLEFDEWSFMSYNRNSMFLLNP